jgi:hypothetical protein
MASKAVLDAVQARQAAGWTTAPVFYPNEALKPPADLSPFVVVEFPIGTSQRLTVAREGTQRRGGTVRFVVHVKLGTSLDTALTYAGELAALFGDVAFDGLELWTPTEPVPIGADGGFYKVSFSVPYSYFA